MGLGTNPLFGNGKGADGVNKVRSQRGGEKHLGETTGSKNKEATLHFRYTESHESVSSQKKKTYKERIREENKPDTITGGEMQERSAPTNNPKK